MESREIFNDGYRSVERRGVPTAGGAHAEYVVMNQEDQYLLGKVNFQSNTVNDVGVEGWTNEALIAVAIDRLEGFQSGDFPNEYNEGALEALKLAKGILDRRTADRIQRGVEGKHEK